MCAGLIMPAIFGGKYEFSPGVRVGNRYGIAVNVPGVRVESILRFKRRPVGQIVFRPDTNSSGRACVRIEFRLKAETNRTAGIQITYRAIGVVQKSFVGNNFEVQRRYQVLCHNLCHADAVVLPGVVTKEVRIVNTPHRVVAVSVAQGQRRQITEHILGDRQVVGSGVEITLFAAGNANRHHRVAAQVIRRQRILGTFFRVRACGGDDIDRCGADHVDVIIGDNGNTLTNAFAHQDRRPVNLHTTTNVLVVQDVGTIIRQHARDAGLAYAKQSDDGQEALEKRFHRVRLRNFAV